MREFLLGGALPTQAFHIAHHGKTVAAILAESKLREDLEDYFDRNRAELFHLSPEKIRGRARADVLAARPELPAAVSPPSRWPDPLTLLTTPELIILAFVFLPVTVPLGASLSTSRFAT